MNYKIKFRDRTGAIFTLAGDDAQTKSAADARIIVIAQAQKDIGAYHATPPHETFGCARASWSDGSYIEVWRVYE